jgi:glutaredoxin
VGLWKWLRNWWHRPALAGVEVVLYTRQGCHLCQEALSPLEKARERHGFRLTVRDVDSDPTWLAAHGEQVPVVEVAGKVRFRGRVNEVLLERLLAALQRGERPA